MSDLKKELEAEGLDTDVIAETLAMSEQQRKDEATDIVARSIVQKVEKQLQTPEALPLTTEQQKAQRLMLEAGGEPTKIEKFLRSNEGYPIDEMNAISVVESQRLKPDKVYYDAAQRQAVKDAVSQFVKEEQPAFSTKLPFSLIEEIVQSMSNANSLELALYRKNQALSAYIEGKQTEYTDWLDDHLKALHCPIALRLKLLSELPKDSEEAMNLLNRARKQLEKKK